MFKLTIPQNVQKPAKSVAELLARGSGVTKKAADASEKALHKAEAQAMKAAQVSRLASVNVQALQDEHEETALEHDLADLRKSGLADDIDMDASQQRAFAGLIREKYGVLIGAAGTGKTTLTKKLIAALLESVDQIDLNAAKPARFKAGDETIETTGDTDPDAKPDMRPAILFCSFTGRAVQQIKRALPREFHDLCDTIHSALGYHPEYYADGPIDPVTGVARTRMVFEPYFNSTIKLPYKIVVVDEAGMVPVELWNALIAALPTDCRIIAIGDINQLPPVAGKSILGFMMANWPTFELTELHRNAGPIAENAHRILHGKMPAKIPGQVDIADFSQMPPGSYEMAKLVIKTMKGLVNAKQFNWITDALIVPQNKKELGQIELNNQLVMYANPPREEHGVIVNRRISIATGMGHAAFAIGDKVMLLANDKALGLTNGMVGVVKEINLNGRYDQTRSTATIVKEVFDEEVLDFDNFSLDTFGADPVKTEAKEKEDAAQRQASHIMTVEFQDGQTKAFSTAGNFRNVGLAYASTCHKCQGGEYPIVVIVVHSANNVSFSREWLYTAFTRARTRVILLGNMRGISAALTTQRIKGVSLAEKIKSFRMSEDQSDESQPQLPKPEKWN